VDTSAFGKIVIELPWYALIIYFQVLQLEVCSIHLNSYFVARFEPILPPCYLNLFKAILSYCSMSTPLRRALSVAIVGGGPGGLTLARILQRNGINPSVFEREASVNVRSQGGSLDLKSGSGLKAMKDAGLMGEFKAHARFDGDATRVQDKTEKVYLEQASNNVKSEDDPRARPEIDRYVHILRAAYQYSNHTYL
jgi:FAD binding domain